LVGPIPEYSAACLDPCTEGQINALERVQAKAPPFTHHTKISDWETAAHTKKIAGLSVLFKATRDSLQSPYRLSRVYHVLKIRDRKQRTEIGKYFFVKRTINLEPNTCRSVELLKLNFLDR